MVLRLYSQQNMDPTGNRIINANNRERLRAANVKTLVNNGYEEVIIFLYEHYNGTSIGRKPEIDDDAYGYARVINVKQ